MKATRWLPLVPVRAGKARSSLYLDVLPPNLPSARCKQTARRFTAGNINGLFYTCASSATLIHSHCLTNSHYNVI